MHFQDFVQYFVWPLNFLCSERSTGRLQQPHKNVVVALKSMKKHTRFLLLIFLMTSSRMVNAQQQFVEGRIRYAVSIGPVSDSTGFTEHAGTYTLIVKGAQVRKELVMNTGYQNVLIVNNTAGNAYSLVTNGGRHYAIQLTAEDLAGRQKRYEGFTTKKMPGNMTIAGWPAEKALITYKDGAASSLYYTTSWKAADENIYDRFPGIDYIPLSFEYRNEEGITMHFQAEKLEATPIENGLFRVPADYKIITNAEYKQQKR